jgi:hypothetical protein
MWKASMDLY